MLNLRRLLAFLLLLGSAGAHAGSTSGTVVVIDPGHGGKDRGTMWGGIAEKTVTLSIARKVEGHLRARGVRTALTRRSDTYRSLAARAAVGNSYRRSVFVSIHCNADPRHRARGIETFYCGAQGYRLANFIHSTLDHNTSTPDRGIKRASFAVLRNTSGAAALVECGFLTSPSERRLLATAAYQDRVARSIATGIIRSLQR
jgi:N-acetylmuramoyl-L-alanine amidase